MEILNEQMNYYKYINKIVRDFFAIILGIAIVLDPTWTEVKFGYGYPYSLVFSIIWIFVFLILLIIDIKILLKKLKNKEE